MQLPYNYSIELGDGIDAKGDNYPSAINYDRVTTSFNHARKDQYAFKPFNNHEELSELKKISEMKVSGFCYEVSNSDQSEQICNELSKKNKSEPFIKTYIVNSYESKEKFVLENISQAENAKETQIKSGLSEFVNIFGTHYISGYIEAASFFGEIKITPKNAHKRKSIYDKNCLTNYKTVYAKVEEFQTNFANKFKQINQTTGVLDHSGIMNQNMTANQQLNLHNLNMNERHNQPILSRMASNDPENIILGNYTSAHNNLNYSQSMNMNTDYLNNYNSQNGSFIKDTNVTTALNKTIFNNDLRNQTEILDKTYVDDYNDYNNSTKMYNQTLIDDLNNSVIIHEPDLTEKNQTVKEHPGGATTTKSNRHSRVHSGEHEPVVLDRRRYSIAHTPKKNRLSLQQFISPKQLPVKPIPEPAFDFNENFDVFVKASVKGVDLGTDDATNLDELFQLYSQFLEANKLSCPPSDSPYLLICEPWINLPEVSSILDIAIQYKELQTQTNENTEIYIFDEIKNYLCLVKYDDAAEILFYLKTLNQFPEFVQCLEQTGQFNRLRKFTEAIQAKDTVMSKLWAKEYLLSYQKQVYDLYGNNKKEIQSFESETSIDEHKLAKDDYRRNRRMRRNKYCMNPDKNDQKNDQEEDAGNMVKVDFSNEQNLQTSIRKVVEESVSKVVTEQLDHFYEVNFRKQFDFQFYDHFFTADVKGNLKQWSISNHRLYNEKNNVYDDWISSMVISNDCRELYISGGGGYLKQFLIKDLSLIQDWGKIHDGYILSLAMSKDSKYLFSGNSRGHLKQWCLVLKKIVKDYGKIHEGGIYSMCCSNDSKNLYTSDNIGYIKNWEIKTNLQVKDWGKINGDNFIKAITLHPDNKTLFAAGDQAMLKQYDCESGKLLKDFARPIKSVNNAIAVTPNGKYLFRGDDRGVLKQYSLEEYKLSRDYGQGHSEDIVGIVVSPNGEYCYTVGGKGEMKCWSITERKLWIDFGIVHCDRISAIAIIPY